MGNTPPVPGNVMYLNPDIFQYSYESAPGIVLHECGHARGMIGPGNVIATDRDVN